MPANIFAKYRLAIVRHYALDRKDRELNCCSVFKLKEGQALPAWLFSPVTGTMITNLFTSEGHHENTTNNIQETVW